MVQLEFRWSVSRGRETAGYNICSLYVDGKKVASTCGGGYDMQGTVLGSYIAGAFADRLLKLKESDMPEHTRWEPNHLRICDGKCREKYIETLVAVEESKGFVGEPKPLPEYPTDTQLCPKCGSETTWSRGGTTISEGRYLYGLRFVDPTYDPGKAVIGKDCSDRCLSKESQQGKTVEQAEKDGVSFGLERLQAAYSATSPFPTETHTVPCIDGACGIDSVRKIMEKIGLSLEWVKGRRNRKNDLYILHDKE